MDDAKVLVIADLSYALHSSFHVFKNLSHKGIPTGPFFGVVSQITSLINKVSATHLIVCKDMKPYKRAKKVASYKAKRSENADPQKLKTLKHNSNLANEFLEKSGIATWAIKGYEADDLIAAAVIKYRSKFDKIYILSADTDLYQVFKYSRKVVFYSKQRFYSIRDFKAEFCLKSVSDWRWIVALTGGHNGLPKIRRIGPVTAKIIVEDEDRFAATMKEHGKVARLNYKVCKLPYDKKWREHFLQNPLRVELNRARAFRVLAKSGIKVSQAMEDALWRLHSR